MLLIKSKPLRWVAYLLFAALIWSHTDLLSAQTPPLEIHVVDASGGVVPGADITVFDRGRLMSLPAMVSGQDGRFFLSLAPGSYVLHVSAAGFRESTQAIDIVDDGAAAPVRVVLQVSERSDTIVVMARASQGADYQVDAISSGTKTLTPLRDVPQSITVVTQGLIRDQAMQSIADVVRYVPGITTHQGENNRDQVVIRGNSSSADFFVNGVRDDVQYYRDLYNLERVEALKGPNAMIFGRGGAGGVINRVTKQPGPTPVRELAFQGGTSRNRRLAADFGQPLTDKLALRLNGVYENSGGFRRYAYLERSGISPTLTVTLGKQTRIALAYEHFRDKRRADRGIPSFAGRPADVDVSTFFGNPKDSRVRATVNLGSAAFEHQAGPWNIRNRTQWGAYDRGYQNYVPGTVTQDKSSVSLSAYNNATQRLNTFNQTDLTRALQTGRMRHTLLAGIEVGRQLTDNFRNTGLFNNSATSILVPYVDPIVTTPVVYRQNATDANNHVTTRLAAGYVQDQVEFSRRLQLIAGLRWDYFDLRYYNNRTAEDLRRIDRLLSPRTGVVIKPSDQLSLYGNYSVSYLPSSGDQFSSLTVLTQQVKPEKFTNYELGAKWVPSRGPSLAGAIYRLDRTNTRSTDPNDPSRIVQTGSQRTKGFELGIDGRVTPAWSVAGGYAYSNALVTSATTNARTGAQVAQVPHHTLSLWNSYQVTRWLGAGLGLVRRSDMYAAVDNTVTLPGYFRADVALFVMLTEGLRLQVNAENLFNRKYYLNADNNTNISPGSPRSLRLLLAARF